MKNKITVYEKKALDYCKKFKNTWELYLVAKDSYLRGYEAGREDSAKVTSTFSKFLRIKKLRPTKKHIEGLTNIIKRVNNTLIDIELLHGAHQLSNKKHD